MASASSYWWLIVCLISMVFFCRRGWISRWCWWREVAIVVWERRKCIVVIFVGKVSLWRRGNVRFDSLMRW